MTDKVTKSLDEIIKETKQTRGGAGGGAGNRRGGARRGGSARGGASNGGGGGRANNGNGGGARGSSIPRRQANGGSVQKRRSGGASASLSPNKAASINGKWSHDLYQNGGAASGGGGGSAKLIISNLDFGVNDSDIENLFAEFGRLKRAAVHYDRSGRSLGTAEVFFERKADAIRAMNHYNGVSLDGRPMNIEVVGTSPTKLVPVVVSPGGPKRGGGAGPNRGGGFRRGGGGGGAGGSGGRGGNGGRGGGGGQRGNRTPRPVKTAADLDADLDAHNAKMQTD